MFSFFGSNFTFRICFASDFNCPSTPKTSGPSASPVGRTRLLTLLTPFTCARLSVTSAIFHRAAGSVIFAPSPTTTMLTGSISPTLKCCSSRLNPFAESVVDGSSFNTLNVECIFGQKGYGRSRSAVTTMAMGHGWSAMKSPIFRQGISPVPTFSLARLLWNGQNRCSPKSINNAGVRLSEASSVMKIPNAMEGPSVLVMPKDATIIPSRPMMTVPALAVMTGPIFETV